MMYHVNPDSGIITRCIQPLWCAYTAVGAQHYETIEDARHASEGLLKLSYGPAATSRRMLNSARLTKLLAHLEMISPLDIELHSIDSQVLQGARRLIGLEVASIDFTHPHSEADGLYKLTRLREQLETNSRESLAIGWEKESLTWKFAADELGKTLAELMGEE